MPQLVWDKVDEKIYETGLDKGVLYLEDGSAVVWNGLTSVIEKSDKDNTPIYFDGQKINNLVSLGDFSATLKAVTYPDEFVELEGLGALRNGVFLGDQEPKAFNLSWRVKVGDAIAGDTLGYKIHILYNLIAIPNDKAYATQGDGPSLVEFEWTLYAVPEETPGFRPTAHVILDSRDVDPWLLEILEEQLYGGEFAEPELMPLMELTTYMKEWYRFKVTDNLDGTYTVLTGRGDAITFSGFDEEIFHIMGIQVLYLDDVTVKLMDTYDLADIPQIKIVDNGDGTWTATTQYDSLFGVTPEGYFQIFNANAVMVAPDEYELSDTTE